ncbi:serine/threonine-protein kinase [Thermomonospora curvata]|uniref:Serine/threonine protein kinase n=1 Tax=Thermomonospora curvata (strain ATCC 19995 / DSM 43183 / JCM 3096 / KCTC 9072 / NBRC 15933 / NCIMB 10081 / Henssen B9) TaxID=471852 RepID=D1AAT3_THECD|nr:serine/threonine-protein kinase [Thermomonospora curvata]ACY97093.1 serine/threonine protein kinase [Thermomonospora curvata DSM 43183]
MEPLQPTDPRQIGPYRLSARLGSGAMGQVYLGRSPGGRPVAVKVIHPAVAAKPNFRARFAREVEAARRVGGFYTAQVVDADPAADPPWLVTAYVPGLSLQEIVAEHGGLPLNALTRLGAGLAEGLAAVHACGLVHRDLKPSNVIVAPDGPRIIDFGIVRALDASTVTATGAFVGTPAYASPEQTRGEPPGPASDVFSFGCVLAFAACGHGPFDAGSLAAVVHKILHQEPDLRRVPAPLRSLIADCLAKDPAARPGVPQLLQRLGGRATITAGWLPPAVASMIADRSTLPEEPPAVTAAPPGPARPAHPVRRRRWRTVALAGVPVLLVATGAAGTTWWRAASSDSGSRSVAVASAVPSVAAALSPAGTAAPQRSAAAEPAGDHPSSTASPPAGAPSSAAPRGERSRAPRQRPGPSQQPVPPAWANCRVYAPVEKDKVAISPCIRATKSGLDMIVNVKALEPQGTPGPVTVWVWIANDKNTKYRASLHKCRMRLKSEEDEGSCGPYSFTPPGPGIYHSAAATSTVDQELPPSWPPQWTGTCSASLRWPA